MKEININDYINQFTRQLKSGGVFLTAGENPNPMTVGWGSIGVYWNKPIITVPIRHSRYTHSLIEESGQFCVSVPVNGMKKELGFCGTRSGRDTDKFAELSMDQLPCQQINTCGIKGAGLHLECQVLAKKDLLGEDLPQEIKDSWYTNNDFHTLYFAEVIAAYSED